jgi:dipeptidyl aminopeptidase/acylaminoacyl peptidase
MLLALMMFSFLASANAGEIEDILADADTWIISDTAKIMSYIDSCQQVFDNKIEQSPYYADTYRDLSFLLGIDYVGSPQIDNTGRIYFMMRITGETAHLFYIDEPMSWPHQLSPNSWPAEGYTIWGYEPHPSGDYILVFAMKYGSERHDIWKFNRDGSFKPLLVNPSVRYSNTIFKNKDEFFLAIDDQENQFFCKYTISTGKLDTIYADPDKEWIGIYDYDKDSDKLLCGRFFSFSETQFFLLDLNTMKTTDITDKGSYDNAEFTGDGRVMFTTNKKSKKNEFNKLVIVDINKPKKMTVLYDPKMENGGYEYIKDQKTIIMTLNKDGYSALAAFDLDGKPIAVPEIPVGVLSGGGNYDENGSTNDLGDFVYGFSSPNTPPTIFHFKLGENKITKLADVATFGFDFSKIKVEVVRYPSKDGTMIPALLYAPKDIKLDGKNPAIVEYHGGPPDQWKPYFQRNLAFGLAKGIVFLRPNVRGSTGYGPEWEKADNRKGRFQALEDDEAAIDYLVNEGYTSYDRVGIWGGSYGGYTVNYLAVNAPEKFACAISQVGVADQDYQQTHGDVGGRNIWEEEFGKVGTKMVHDLSPIWKSNQLQRPILLTAGFYDPRVFPGDPRRFSYLLGKLGKEVYYLEDTKAGHGATTKESLITEFSQYYTFFLEHIMK